MTADRLPIVAVAADRPPLMGDADLKTTLGGYLAAAVPDFYRLVPIAADTLHATLGDAIGAPGSEFANAFMAGTAESPAGIVTSLPVETLQRAQQASTITLMRKVDNDNLAAFRSAVADYSTTVEPVEGPGEYLSRVTVAPDSRGQGVGRRLVERVIELAEGGDVWLHVAGDNRKAIALYEMLGFEFASGQPYASRAMRRRGEGAAR